MTKSKMKEVNKNVRKKKKNTQEKDTHHFFLITQNKNT